METTYQEWESINIGDYTGITINLIKGISEEERYNYIKDIKDKVELYRLNCRKIIVSNSNLIRIDEFEGLNRRCVEREIFKGIRICVYELNRLNSLLDKNLIKKIMENYFSVEEELVINKYNK